MKLIDLTDKRLGRLLIIKRAGNDAQGKTKWLCLCDCGKQTVVLASSLTTLTKVPTRSCGCLGNELRNTRCVTHGATGTPEYRAYNAAKSRCNNKNVKQYNDWGGRGIKFLYINFVEFLQDVGPRPSTKHSLDRINVDGHYVIGNCRWATAKEQNMNKRTIPVSKVNLVTWLGEVEGQCVWDTICTNYNHQR